MPSYTFSYDATPELARKAALRYMWRQAGWWLILLVAVLLFSIYLLLSGDRNWYVFLLLAYGLVKGWACIRGYIRAGSTEKGIADPTVTVHLDDECFGIKYAHVDSKMSWLAPLEIWQFQELWLITFLETKSQTYIPTHVMGEAVKRFFETKVIENGGRIK